VSGHHRWALLRKKSLVARAARASFPALPADDPDAASRQAEMAWSAVTVVAAVPGMDAPWFRTCLEALGLLPYDSAPGSGSRYTFGQVK